jgi:hypothetical protein
MTNKFTAVYYVNKFGEEDGTFGHELLDLHTLFESPCEETGTIGEHTPTYDCVTEGILLDYPAGCYSVFVMGYLVYTKDYYGEVDLDEFIEYHSVTEVPIEMVIGDD